MSRNASPSGQPLTMREEFRVKRLSMRFEHYELFVYSQCLPTWLLWLIRLIMGSFCVAVFSYLSATSPFINFSPENETEAENATEAPVHFKQHFYLCYLTVWSYLIITLYFLVTVYNMISLKCQFRSRYPLNSSGFRSTDNLVDWQQEVGMEDTRLRAASGCNSTMLRVQWLLYGVAANAALVVTAAYFGVLYPLIKAINPGPVAAVDLYLHGLNSVFMFLEVVCSGVPVQLLHGLYTVAYGLLYVIFSILYWLPDHSNVMYPILLDWNSPGLTLVMIAALLFLGMPIVQLFWWLVYKARCAVAGQITRLTYWDPEHSV